MATPSGEDSESTSAPSGEDSDSAQYEADVASASEAGEPADEADAGADAGQAVPLDAAAPNSPANAEAGVANAVVANAALGDAGSPAGVVLAAASVEDPTGVWVERGGEEQRRGGGGDAEDASAAEGYDTWYARNGIRAQWLYGDTLSAATAPLENLDAIWERLGSDLNQAAGEAGVEIVVGSGAVVTTAVSVGYVIWMVRGSALLASLASSLPTWSLVDPLPVLEQPVGGATKKKADAEEESLQAMLERANRTPAGTSGP